mmetsp:Transcript_1834/g.3816  ORF Transcript_1834/g.3816 Transcript_1834/m.3816 type:complete len:486 (-) Transcript_1834:152-1609(-)
MAEGQGNPFVEELRRNFPLYAVFHIGNFMLMLVNKFEQTFARSLIHCDEPFLPDGIFTGSAFCGDRLTVVNGGQTLSSTGQALECLFKVCAMVLVAVVADVLGRKPVLILGLACTTLSIFIFVVAIYSPSATAFRLFALGQGLQGVFPSELLGSIVANDISNEAHSDPVLVQQVGGLFAMLTMVLAEIISVYFNASTSTDFRSTWGLIAIVNCVVAAFAASSKVRETKPNWKEKENEHETLGIVKAVKSEVWEYGHLLWTNRVLRLNLVGFAFSSLAFVGTTLDSSFYIAYYGISQADAALHFAPKLLIGVLAFGAVDAITKRVGCRRGFVGLLSSLTIGHTFIFPCLLLSSKVFLFYQYWAMCYMGLFPFANAIDTRWFDQRLTAKFLSMKSLVQYFTGICAHPIYAALFDAHAPASQYFRRMRPYLLQYLAQAGQLCLILGPLWSLPHGLPEVLDRIDAERKEKSEAAAAGGEKKNDNTKKTD